MGHCGRPPRFSPETRIGPRPGAEPSFQGFYFAQRTSIIGQAENLFAAAGGKTNLRQTRSGLYVGTRTHGCKEVRPTPDKGRANPCRHQKRLGTEALVFFFLPHHKGGLSGYCFGAIRGGLDRLCTSGIGVLFLKLWAPINPPPPPPPSPPLGQAGGSRYAFSSCTCVGDQSVGRLFQDFDRVTPGLFAPRGRR